MVLLKLDLDNISNIILRVYSQQEDSEDLDQFIEDNGEILGKGSYGEVYSIQNHNLDDIVIKISNRKAVYCILSFEKFDKISKFKNFKYRRSSPNKIFIEDKDNLDEYIIKKMLSNNQMNYFYKDNWLYCESDSEYIISCCCTQLVNESICCHFPKIYAFKKGSQRELDIKDDKIIFESKSYLFMEKIHEELCLALYSNINNESNDIKDKIVNVITFQILFSVACYQRFYKIVHHDLTLRNIMVDYFTDEFLDKNKKLKYRIDDKVYKIDSIPFYVKIIDFGLGHKHSEPKIINNTTGLDDEIFTRHKNEYIPLTDVIFYTLHMKYYLSKYLDYENEVLNNIWNKYSKFYIDKVENLEIENILDRKYNIFYGTKNEIPYITSEDILKENMEYFNVEVSDFLDESNFLGILE